ncbi:uncharacterized protein LOC135717641 isoform X2 [Ochlerotatus camptorhynchus]|uniref:uncharacterized protein LOC135717641 isoform X2 n=1 Tax=Ochlerotatus camptorhynchus TaxID=644619 RepID=UPI0031E24447
MTTSQFPISCIIFTTSIAVLILILTTKPCASVATSNDHDHDDNDDRYLIPVPLISPNRADLPRPIVTPLDPSQVQPKRMKLKVSSKRRKHQHNKAANRTTSSSTAIKNSRPKHKRKPTMQNALQSAVRKGLEAMVELYDKREPDMIRRGAVLDPEDPGALLSKFSSSDDLPENITRSAYAALVAAKQLKDSTNVEYVALGRQVPPKISLKRTPLEGMCPSREPPPCVPASRRYRTHDGTCNNRKRPRWGSAQMPFHRFLAPEYADGVEGIRRSIANNLLPSARFISLVVHGARQEEAPVTMMLALWGQLLDHDLTATAQPRSLNGSTPRCCGRNDEGLHPSCLPIKVPLDDPWLSPLGVRCLEFLRSAPAQRRDCLLSWREQTNQVTSYIDASPIYSSNPRTSDNARIFRNGMLLFGRGPPSEDVCFRAALANQCIRPGDARSGEQPGLLMLHMIWVNEHNQIATQLSDINPHWSDEKLYQEARRIVGAVFQHITFREFLPIILGKEVCHLFDLDLENSGFYRGYDPNVNPTVANEFSAAAFRFGHSLIQGSYMRADRHHRFIVNNVTLHEESAEGDLGGPGSLHRLVRGMVNQRALKRDEFITAELTNHLFQTRSFPFGLDLAAINIQRGRDHGIQPYINWRIPCGLTPIKDWADLDRVMGPASALRLRKAYRSVDDIDLFVGGLAERPVVGGIVGPTFACIIAQQFGNLRKGDRFWYENPGFESSFTPAQLESIRQVAFSQVLCRALGSGTLQPHVFLPADTAQNERLPCDSKLMAPIDLEPWTERDPFTRPNDDTEQSDNDVSAPQSVFSTTTTRKPTKNANIVNKVDFTPNGNTGLQIPSNGQIVLNSPRPSTTVVNNKLDLTPNTPRPTASQTTPPRPIPHKDPIPTPSTGIDNKLDLTGTTAPPKRKPTRKTTPKRRPTVSTNVIINNIDFSLKRDSTDNVTDDEERKHSLTKRDLNLSKLFTKEDNATLHSKIHNNALRSGYYAAPAPAPPSDYDDVNYYNIDSDPPVFVKPGYGHDSGYGLVTNPPPNPYYGSYYTTEPPPPPPPPQPPYCGGYSCYNPPLTTYNPYGQDTRRPANRRTTLKHVLTNKIITSDYDNDQLLNRQTTRRPQSQTQNVFQRPGLLVINNVRPNDKPIFLSPSPSTPVLPSSSLNSNVFLQSSKNPSPSAASQSVFSVDPRPQYSSSRPIAHQPSSVPSPIFSQKNTSNRKPQKQLFATDHTDQLPSRILPPLLIQDYDYDIPDANRHDTLNVHEHDGYLRPEQNKYEPLKKTNDQWTYRNYSYYNARETGVIDGYKILPTTNATLWSRTDPERRRYAERYQQPLKVDDDDLDQYVGPYIDRDKTAHNHDEPDDTDQHADVEVTDNIDLTETETGTNKTESTDFKTKVETANEKNQDRTKQKDQHILLKDYLKPDKPDEIRINGHLRDKFDNHNIDNPLFENLTNSKNTLDKSDSNEIHTINETYNDDQLNHINDQTSLPTENETSKDSNDKTQNSLYDDQTLESTEDSHEHDDNDHRTNDTIHKTTLDLIDSHDHNLSTELEAKTNSGQASQDHHQLNLDRTVQGDSKLTDRRKLTKPTHGQTYYDEYDQETEPDDILPELDQTDVYLKDSDSIDPLTLLNIHDAHARTPDRVDAIESILPVDETETINDLSKPPLLTDPTRRPDKTPHRPQRPDRRTTSNPRRRRPTSNSKRPTTTGTTHGHGHHNDRRQPGIALVPFVLLTSIERPDNWVMFNVAKSKKRNPLPDVPQLKSDAFSLSELPKPISAED